MGPGSNHEIIMYIVFVEPGAAAVISVFGVGGVTGERPDRRSTLILGFTSWNTLVDDGANWSVVGAYDATSREPHRKL
jgi:hypothetical protein